mgnify:CR=1 FL=1
MRNSQLKIKGWATALLKWESATSELASEFVNKYFKGNDDNWWVAEEIGGCFVVGDYFWDMNDIVTAIRHNIPAKKLFGYYDYRIKLTEKGKPVDYNMRSFCSSKKL